MSKSFKFLLGFLSICSTYNLLINGRISSPYVQARKKTYGEIARTYQLTDQTRPLSYELRIVPDLEKFIFTGEVRITVTTKTSTNDIKLHSSKYLTITSCLVFNGETPVPSIHKLEADKDLLVIETSQQLAANISHVLVIKFQGVLNQELKGFYRSWYTVEDKKYWLAVTQFELTYAREAFPCFDEPRFKTPFTIYLAHFSNQKAISNMPIETKSPVDPAVGNRIWTKFQTSPPMPTYLVAFVVSESNFVNKQQKRVNVWMRENAIQYSSYALEQATTILEYLEDYTDIPFTLPKLDIVGVPEEEFDGMENWGMVTFREGVIIMNEQANAEEHKSQMYSLLCHEIAHQWFGNLATPASWDTYWLKEGFATYFQYFAVAAQKPLWNMDQLFVIEAMQYALTYEIATPRAMTTLTQNIEEIGVIVDATSYEKAASVIRMFEHMVTPRSFETALRNFLKNGAGKHNGVVEPSNLFDEFERSVDSSISLPSGVSVTQIMKMWTENIGFPLITITQNVHRTKYLIETTTYEVIGSSDIPADQEWIVPLTYTTKRERKFSDTKPTLWSHTEKVIELPIEVNRDDWVLFNLQQTGYYRVNYDWKNWELLINQLHRNLTEIHVLNRAQLISDSMAMAANGKLSYNLVFKLVEYLPKETEMIPWLSAIEPLSTLFHQYEVTSFQIFYKEYLLYILKPAVENLGFDIKSTDGHLEKIVKPKFLYFACEIGVKSCIEKALDEYTKNKEDLSKVQQDLKAVVFCTALRHSNDQHSAFNNIWSTYLKATIPYDKCTILSALECIRKNEIVNTILSKLIDSKNDDFGSQEKSHIETAIASQVPFATASIQFLNDQISMINELDEYGISVFESILRSVVIKTQTHLVLFKKLLTKMDTIDQKKYAHLKKLTEEIYTKGMHRISDNEVIVPNLELLMRQYRKNVVASNIASASLSLPFLHWPFLNILAILFINNVHI